MQRNQKVKNLYLVLHYSGGACTGGYNKCTFLMLINVKSLNVRSVAVEKKHVQTIVSH